MNEDATLVRPVAGGDSSATVNEDDGRWNWFIYQQGKLIRVDEPAWTSLDDDFEKAVRKANVTKVESCGTIEGAFSVEVYSYDNQPRWFFQFGGNLIYTVEVAGFPDYLEFLAKVAPIATTGITSDAYLSDEEWKRMKYLKERR